MVYTPHNPAILLLGICPTEKLVFIKTYAIMFIKALFVIVQTGNDPNAINRRMLNKLWYSCIVEYYTLTRRNASQLHTTIRMNSINIVLSKINQTQKST